MPVIGYVAVTNIIPNHRIEGASKRMAREIRVFYRCIPSSGNFRRAKENSVEAAEIDKCSIQISRQS